MTRRELPSINPMPPDEIISAVTGGEPVNSHALAASIYRIARELHEPTTTTSHENNSSSLRIAMVIPYNPLYEVGGLEIGTRKLAEGLQKIGHHVEIISRGKYDDKNLVGEHQTAEGISVYGVGSGIEDIVPYLLQRSADFDVVQWMEIFPPVPELANTYNDKAEQQYLSSVLLRSQGVKTFLYTATSGNVKNRGTNNPDWSQTRKNQPLNTLIKSAMIGIDAINADIFKEYEEAGIKTPDVRRSVIPLGVDTEHFSRITKEDQQKIREKLGLPTDKTIIFYVGRFVKRKRPDLLLKIWRDLPEDIINKAHLVFIGGKAGDGQPDSIYHQVMDSIEQHNRQRREKGLNENISCFDLVDHEEMPKYMQAGDAMVFPSEREGLGMVILEAMACGKPVFASDISGIRDVIPNSSVGTRFNPADVDEIRSLMSDFIVSPDKYAVKGVNGHQYVESNWSWQSISQKLSQFYKTFQSP